MARGLRAQIALPEVYSIFSSLKSNCQGVGNFKTNLVVGTDIDFKVTCVYVLICEYTHIVTFVFLFCSRCAQDTCTLTGESHKTGRVAQQGKKCTDLGFLPMIQFVPHASSHLCRTPVPKGPMSCFCRHQAYCAA